MKINKIYSLLTFLLLPLLMACSGEIDEQPQWGAHTRRMVLDGVLQTYGPDTRASSITFPKGAVMYLQLGDIRTVATFDGSEWALTLPDGLADDASGTCTAYYFEQASTSFSSVSLTASSVVYKGTGSFSNSKESLTVSATVRPLLARVHFKGTVGTSISVSGLEYYSAFNTSSHTFTSNSGSLSLTVQSSGYTPYVYALLGSSRTLSVSDGTFTFTRSFATSVMRAGESGYLDIPTRSSHAGWTSDEQTDVTLNGNEYGGDSDWNQPDKEPTKDLDVSGTDFDGDSNWNQPDKEPTNEVDAGKEDYDGDSDWNQSDPYTPHDYVDLGLSVKWATCNVGADYPEDYGDYFAWGETETKSTYDWSTYKWSSNEDWNGMTKYTYPDGKTSGIWYSNGTFVGDNKTNLDPEDDVAHVKWGGSWRMPTLAEQDELRNTNNCTWTWTTQGGKNGYLVTSKQNGNSIFLPASGYRYDSYLNAAGSRGYYWSSSLGTGYSDNAFILNFSSGDVYSILSLRDYGRSVRPVCP